MATVQYCPLCGSSYIHRRQKDGLYKCDCCNYIINITPLMKQTKIK